ncbi:MAG: zinc metallopeptidase [Ruminococcaceae bacterium]|nr:zinc metallopeptidase [Oscillospiraceae bacterium]
MYISVASDPLSLFLYGLAIVIFIASIVIQASVKSTFNRYNGVKNRRNITGAQAAQAVLHKNGVYDCRVEMISGELTDHYDPQANVIRLSEAVYKSASVAAVGVAAHEAGHAVQYATEYGPIRIRGQILPVVQFASRFSWILIFLGFLLDIFLLGSVGVALFAVTTLFYLITLPIELDASRRALAAIGEPDMLDADEKVGAKKVLTTAALTYVAALAASIVSLLRLIVNVSRRD